jgi:hypothetical protein
VSTQDGRTIRSLWSLIAAAFYQWCSATNAIDLHWHDLRWHDFILSHSQTSCHRAAEAKFHSHQAGHQIVAWRRQAGNCDFFHKKKLIFDMVAVMIFLYVLLGLLVGVLSGIVGIGGGILIIPALVYFFHMNQHKAQGTSLAALLAPIGALAFWEYYKAGNVDLKAGLLIALGFLVGGYFGGVWAQHLPEVVLRKVFGTLLAIIGIQLLLSR